MSSPAGTAEAYLYEPLASSSRSHGSPVSAISHPAATGASAAARRPMDRPLDQTASTDPSASRPTTTRSVDSSPNAGISTKPVGLAAQVFWSQ